MIRSDSGTRSRLTRALAKLEHLIQTTAAASVMTRVCKSYKPGQPVFPPNYPRKRRGTTADRWESLNAPLEKDRLTFAIKLKPDSFVVVTSQ